MRPHRSERLGAADKNPLNVPLYIARDENPREIPLNIGVVRADRVDIGKTECRILVDRRWPSGLSKSRLALDAWLKDVAPSPGLSEWFESAPDEWDRFRDRYFRELESKPPVVEELFALVRKQPVRLVFGSANELYNSAVALRDFLLLKLTSSSPVASFTQTQRLEKAS